MNAAQERAIRLGKQRGGIWNSIENGIRGAIDQMKETTGGRRKALTCPPCDVSTIASQRERRRDPRRIDEAGIIEARQVSGGLAPWLAGARGRALHVSPLRLTRDALLQQGHGTSRFVPNGTEVTRIPDDVRMRIQQVR